jgi:hypothetical protein
VSGGRLTLSSSQRKVGRSAGSTGIPAPTNALTRSTAASDSSPTATFVRSDAAVPGGSDGAYLRTCSFSVAR